MHRVQQQLVVESEQRVWQELRIFKRGYAGSKGESMARKPQKLDVTDRENGYMGGMKWMRLE
jgi:hypothetical protein